MLNPSTIFSVSALNIYIKSIFDEDEVLQSVYVRGEISSFRRHTSGHLYLTLKDEKSRIKAVMFASKAYKLSFIPKEGDEVFILGKISVYPENGEYQVYIEEMEPYGKGKQLIELEKLKKRLFEEGLFDEKRKKPIPQFPRAIGLVTGKGSAASADMIKNITRRYPLVQIYLFPSLVQGANAPQSLIKALKTAEKYDLDTIIIGRGGGANEDLSAFNDEGVVRAIAECNIPIISAVGHEIDFTLSDLAADKRVSTPTGAAENATPDIEALYLMLDSKRTIMQTILLEKYRKLKEKFTILSNLSLFKDPSIIYQNKLKDLKAYKEKINMLLNNSLIEDKHRYISLKNALNDDIIRTIESYKQQIELLKSRLMLLNPLTILERGYSIVEDEEGHVIESVKDVNAGTRIITTFKDGSITSIVEKKGE